MNSTTPVGTLLFRLLLLTAAAAATRLSFDAAIHLDQVVGVAEFFVDVDDAVAVAGFFDDDDDVNVSPNFSG